MQTGHSLTPLLESHKSILVTILRPNNAAVPPVTFLNRVNLKYFCTGYFEAQQHNSFVVINSVPSNLVRVATYFY